MELTEEQLEVIKQASREIDFGRVIIDFTGAPSFVVDITAEKRHRFQRHRRAEPTIGEDRGRRSRGSFRKG